MSKLKIACALCVFLHTPVLLFVVHSPFKSIECQREQNWWGHMVFLMPLRQTISIPWIFSSPFPLEVYSSFIYIYMQFIYIYKWDILIFLYTYICVCVGVCMYVCVYPGCIHYFFPLSKSTFNFLYIYIYIKIFIYLKEHKYLTGISFSDSMIFLIFFLSHPFI